MPHLERLQNLRRVVAAIDPKLLAMDTWECGTMACALGHACRDPWHQKQGLRFASMLDGNSAPHYEGHYRFSAAKAFYEITYTEALNLFQPGAFRDHSAVPPIIAEPDCIIPMIIERIDDILAESMASAEALPCAL